MHLLTYLLTPWCRVLLEKLPGLQLVKKFPAFHGTRRFITALTSVHHLSLSILGQPNPVHIPTSHLLEISPNIIHPSTPMSPQWSLSLRFPHQEHAHAEYNAPRNIIGLLSFGLHVFEYLLSISVSCCMWNSGVLWDFLMVDLGL